MDGGGGEALPLVPTANLLPAFPLTILVAVPERVVMLEGMRDEADLLTVTAVKVPPQHGHRLRGRERQWASRPQRRDGAERKDALPQRQYASDRQRRSSSD